MFKVKRDKSEKGKRIKQQTKHIHNSILSLLFLYSENYHHALFNAHTQKQENQLFKSEIHSTGGLVKTILQVE